MKTPTSISLILTRVPRALRRVTLIAIFAPLMRLGWSRGTFGLGSVEGVVQLLEHLLNDTTRVVTIDFGSRTLWFDTCDDARIRECYHSHLFDVGDWSDYLAVLDRVHTQAKALTLPTQFPFTFEGVNVTRDSNGVVEMNPTELLKRVQVEVNRRLELEKDAAATIV